MSSPIITIENLGKKYRLAHQSERPRYTALRDVIAEQAKRTFLGRSSREYKGSKRTEEFSALKDISLEIIPGEVVGIIGRNGAGKSTLLKILSRITEPTTGRVRIRGRVASLLEVGTGFHPELTGRENIYLNAAILGMTRAEMRGKFDEIVAFAEVEKFLDTPVKRYSSGMYVRLAFAVAAHVEPEIMVVDEVLAVGDAEFQKKCLGKMEHISRAQGRTVLFVSHNLPSIRQLCTRALLLKQGMLAESGGVAEVCELYLQSQDSPLGAGATCLDNDAVFRYGEGSARITKLELIRANGIVSSSFFFGEPIRLRIYVQANRRLRDYIVGFSLNTIDGQVLVCSNHYDSLDREALLEGTHVFTCVADGLWLAPGRYTITLAVTSGDQRGPLDFIQTAAFVEIEPFDFYAIRETKHLLDLRPGFIRRPHKWCKENVETTDSNSVSIRTGEAL
jgi:lipopolysaccharide transport system ATP-binding protein